MIRKLAFQCSRCKAYNSEMPCICGVCKAPLISAMQIARSKQEKIDKLVPRYFIEEERDSPVHPKKTNPDEKGKRMDDSKKMDIENGSVVPQMVKKPQRTCAGCETEILRNGAEDDYFSECTDCSSEFCSDCDLLIVDSLRFCPICQE